jgi:hypothetical protein
MTSRNIMTYRTNGRMDPWQMMFARNPLLDDDAGMMRYTLCFVFLLMTYERARCVSFLVHSRYIVTL